MALLAEICIASLCFSDLSADKKTTSTSFNRHAFFEQGRDTDTSYSTKRKPLVKYAPRYWLAHIQALKHVPNTLKCLYNKLLQYSSQFGPFWLYNWLETNKPNIPISVQNGLCQAKWTEAALMALLGDIQGLTQCTLPQETAPRFISPLYASVVSGNVAIAMLLLKNGVNPNDSTFDGTLLLHWIFAFDYKTYGRDISDYVTILKGSLEQAQTFTIARNSLKELHFQWSMYLSRLKMLNSSLPPAS
jgi:hypothetical protein